MVLVGFAKGWDVVRYGSTLEVSVTFRSGEDIVFVAAAVLPAGTRCSRRVTLELVADDAADAGYRVAPDGRTGLRMKLFRVSPPRGEQVGG